MSLDHFQLTPDLLQGLYKNSLIINETGQLDSSSEQSVKFTFLGNNQKNIVFIVDHKEAIYLPDEELSFLMDILTACRLSMADIALLNLAVNPALDYTAINSELKAEKVICFGIATPALQLPIQFPNYQVQHYNNQVYLASPSLTVLQDDKAEKTKLWTCLKKIFLPD